MSRPILPVNRYVERKAVKEGTCFICGYFTPSIFVTENDAPRDWFFVCPKHTTETSFCTLIEGGQVPEPAQDVDGMKEPEVKKKEKSDGKDAKDETKKGSEREEDSKSPTPPPAPAAPTRKVYTLHRDYMYLRQRPFIQRWEKEQADLLAQRLPSVPKHRPS
ncbi:hypothetical protein DL89DRAFT_292773 [Linderina pennispora]|uniref:DUF1742-domain-containing protein n=1 Tax=Linderina pennispora TaxID=61395 RepID=A0A1Y1WA40_9FUNG|nr:uncharacterized protein DL89DRAFT_292773 [Linderina pennispora]ORX70106.1 hypothetical protein DL89DRAFT_292773 [Linderina pennispora]